MVGGGVIGLTTAVVLAEGGHTVRVWTKDPVERTTSAVAGALWWPYRIEPEELVGPWSLESLGVYTELAADPERTGVRLVAGVQGGTRLDGLGAWAREVPGMRAATAAEYGPGGLWARLPLIDMPVYLAWLLRRLLAAGGTVETRAVADLAEAGARAPVVVDCAGLGARTLASDDTVYPVRGQLVVVANPGIETWFAAPDPASRATTHIFPFPGRLVLGGTAEADDFSRVPDPAVAAAIVERCARIRPEIAGAQVLGHLVGLRPARPAVRIEREALPYGGTVVHNYGHGGAGVTVAWGAARQAARLVS